MKPAVGDALRVVPMILWMLLILGGVAFLAFDRRATPVSATASRDLPQNTLLLGDMLTTKLAGRYLVRPGGVKSGEAIQDSDVGNEPILSAPPPARILLMIPVPPASVGAINAGTMAQLCADNSLTATVVYVHCDGKINPACAATVELPTESLKSLADHATSVKTLRLSEPCT